MLLVAAILVLAKQYVGQSIQCWIPKHFTSPWEQYIENYCFVENTYFLKVTETGRTPLDTKREREVPYYQWVPFFLIGLVFLFLVPRKIWRTLNWRSGVNVSKIVEFAFSTHKDKKNLKMLKNIKEEDAEKSRKQIVDYITECILLNIEKGRFKSKGQFGDVRKRFETSYITHCYVLYKCLHLTISVGMLFVFNFFLGYPYRFWGFGVVNDLVHGRHWQESAWFPRITFCDVTHKTLESRSTHTVQCVLMLNLFNEKIFIFLWFWFLILSLFNAINIIYWIVVSYFDKYSYGLIRKHLIFRSVQLNQLTYGNIEAFIRKFIRMDGLTIIRLVSDNCGDQVGADIVKELWRKSQDKKFSKTYYEVHHPQQSHINPTYSDPELKKGH
ncbi:hypothetical protein L596_008112 [Steinernema carpocapsae]|uniref:Innexin n=1 Tax=Steinernema carpocapsae TaxID=34508 RepID=A0A4U5PBJ6_STECR|nr:hypothetical protein L596_008112 [Steinernema carpocapsae]